MQRSVSRSSSASDSSPIAPPLEVIEPLEMMAVAARRAADDAGLGALRRARLAHRHQHHLAGLRRSRRASSPRASAPSRARAHLHEPRRQLAAVARQRDRRPHRARRGRLALIAGAEAMHGLQLARKAGRQARLGRRRQRPATGRRHRWGNNDDEQRHHAQMPTTVYPLFENALRARRGWSIARHRDHLGELCAALRGVAARQPVRLVPRRQDAPTRSPPSAATTA